jgi:hypothetical protein
MSELSSGFTLYELGAAEPIMNARWTAVALLYGPPRFTCVREGNNDTYYRFDFDFGFVIEKVFHPEEINRIGWSRLMHDYKEWYDNQSHSV